MTDETIFGGLDPELVTRVVSRREALRETGRRAGIVAMASMPVAFGLMARRAFGQANIPQEVIDALNFALTLEYLESEFYVTGLPTANVGDALTILEQIRDQELAHVTTLQTILGGPDKAITKPVFDFTAGGTFNDVFTNPTTFISVAQAFEDLGVRAYKGQAAVVQAEDAVVTTVLRLHSVEARHAAAIRRLTQSPGVKGWITGNDSATGALAAVYTGEENTIQLGVDVTPFGNADAVTEAFDEPLAQLDVEAIIAPFIVTPGEVPPPA